MKKLLLLLGIGLLSCISFSSASSFQQSNYFNVSSPSYYQFSPFNDLQSNSILDGFICFQIGGGKLNNFNITDSNWTSIAYFDGQDIGNFANSICFYLSDFLQNYNLMIQSNYQLSVQYYYMYVVPVKPVSCYTGVMNIKLVNGNSNTENNLYYEFSPYSQYNAVYSIYFTGVYATSIQNGILLEGNDCSSIQSDLNTCSTNFQSCQGYLNSCQSDYSSCDSSLSSCQSDLNSASGYVSSLEGELNQCANDLLNCGSSSNSGSCESGSNWSALYINDIQHLGKPNIFITIPEEIDWDYTSEGDDFDLDVVGYNVDTEYIDGIIRTQNYKPSSEDFSKLVGMLAPYSKYLIFLVFIFIIWAWIKKPFKSKKL